MPADIWVKMADGLSIGVNGLLPFRVRGTLCLMLWGLRRAGALSPH